MTAPQWQLGFTLIETAATVAAGMVLLTAGTVWMLGMHPGALAVAAGDTTPRCPKREPSPLR